MKEKLGPDVNTDNPLLHWGRSVGFGQNPIPLARSSQLITASREPGSEHMAPTIAHLSCSMEPCLVAVFGHMLPKPRAFRNLTKQSRVGFGGQHSGRMNGLLTKVSYIKQLCLCSLWGMKIDHIYFKAD